MKHIQELQAQVDRQDKYILELEARISIDTKFNEAQEKTEWNYTLVLFDNAGEEEQVDMIKNARKEFYGT